jgi:hypothetical protein
MAFEIQLSRRVQTLVINGHPTLTRLQARALMILISDMHVLGAASNSSDCSDRGCVNEGLLGCVVNSLWDCGSSCSVGQVSIKCIYRCLLSEDNVFFFVGRFFV